MYTMNRYQYPVTIPAPRRLNPKQLAEHRRLRLARAPRVVPLPAPDTLSFAESFEEWCNGLGLGFLLVALTVFLFSMGCGAPVAHGEQVESLMAAWGVLEMPDWQINVVDPETMARECEIDADKINACTFQEARTTWIRDDLGSVRERDMLLHELGHLIRGGANVHLDCGEEGGEDVMCGAGSETSSEPTDRDRTFVGL